MSKRQKTQPSQTLGPRAFLKHIGFALDKKPHQIDRLLLKSLSEEDAAALEVLWAARNLGFSDDLELYIFPKSLKSAVLLFSYDWPRAVATMEWFEETLKKTAPTTVVEMGAGAGFLLAYLQVHFPAVRFQGIDAATNLCEVGSRLLNKFLIAGDYLTTKPDDQYDLILCDFGFDNSHFKASTRPHLTETVAGVSYCSCCSDDLKIQFDAYLRAWRRWSNRDGKFAITGRFSNFGMLRALVLSASDVGWVPNLEMSKVLTVKMLDGFERFPALVFDSVNAGTTKPDMELIASFFSS
jgi:hypothetical protein